MKKDKKRVLKVSVTLSALLFSGFWVGTEIDAGNEKLEKAQLFQSTKQTKLGNPEVDAVKGKLKKEVRDKVQMPKKFPSKVKYTVARIDDLLQQDMLGEAGDELIAYEQFFELEDGTRISVRVHPKGAEVNYQDDSLVETEKLKNGNQAKYFDNGTGQGLDFVDKKTGYQYMVTISYLPDTKMKLKKKDIIELVESFDGMDK